MAATRLQMAIKKPQLTSGNNWQKIFIFNQPAEVEQIYQFFGEQMLFMVIVMFLEQLSFHTILASVQQLMRNF